MKRWVWTAYFKVIETGERFIERSSRTFGDCDEADRDLQDRIDGKVPFEFARKLIWLPDELLYISGNLSEKEA